MNTPTPEPPLGMCHGPGCRRPQMVPFWCSERCQAAWEARWGKRLPDYGPLGLLAESVRVATESSRVSSAIAAMMQPASGAVAMANLVEVLRDLPPAEPLEPFKLTRAQLEALRAASPTYPDYARPPALLGTPIVLVDRVEESTPFQRAFPEAPEVAGVSVAPLAAEGPQEATGWLGRLLGRLFGHKEEKQ